MKERDSEFGDGTTAAAVLEGTSTAAMDLFSMAGEQELVKRLPGILSEFSNWSNMYSDGNCELADGVGNQLIYFRTAYQDLYNGPRTALDRGEGLWVDAEP